MELDPIPFSLRSDIEDALQSLSLRAHEKGLELACDIAEDVPAVVVGDPGRLRQIILNLAGNAIKFTDHGEVILRVQIDSQQDKPVRLHFSVRDTGVGIPPEKQGLIFEPFSQADGSTTRRHGGTGLGLTICKRLVEMMGGEIWLESATQQGTTFHFTAQFEPHNERIGSPATAADLTGLRVLALDNNETNRRILVELLKRWRMRPADAETGAGALSQLEHGDFDLLLLDIEMPEMDGFEVARQIRERWPQSPIKIVMLTSIGHPGDAARRRALNVDAELSKPVRSADLLKTIQRLFVQRAEPPASPRLNPAPGHSMASAPLEILLVEDNEVNRTLVRLVLQKVGHTITTAHNGREAIDAVEAGAFDLVLMDIQMPDMDGFEATAEIRRREIASRRNRLPIIALTAHAMSGDRERCQRAGMDGYVTKPIQVAQLMEEIELTRRIVPA